MLKKNTKYFSTVLVILFLAFNYFIMSNQVFAADDILGEIPPPEAISKFNAASGGEIGALFFLSRLIRFSAIAAGIFSLWNFISAGFTYITSAGNTAAHATVRDKITWSLVGIIVIVAAYTIVGVISFVIFKDPTYMLNPQIKGVFGV